MYVYRCSHEPWMCTRMKSRTYATHHTIAKRNKWRNEREKKRNTRRQTRHFAKLVDIWMLTNKSMNRMQESLTQNHLNNLVLWLTATGFFYSSWHLFVASSSIWSFLTVWLEFVYKVMISTAKCWKLHFLVYELAPSHIFLNWCFLFSHRSLKKYTN